jgi:hypothetical protein
VIELGSLVKIAMKLDSKPTKIPKTKGNIDFLYLEDKIET